MVTTNADAQRQSYSVSITPYASLDRKGGLLVFVLVGVPIVAGAIASGLMGFWHALPASLMVVAGVGAGLFVGHRRTHMREVVSIDPDTVAIEKGHRRPERRFEFPRGGAQVWLEEPPASGRPRSRLFVGSLGRQVEIGAYLDEAERHDLADRLRHLLAAARLRQPLAAL